MAAESIYGWIKEAPPPPQRPPMYHSRIDPTKLEIPASTFRETAARKPYGVVGREVKATVRPDAFLRAHEKTTTGIDTKTMREYSSGWAKDSPARVASGWEAVPAVAGRERRLATARPSCPPF